MTVACHTKIQLTREELFGSEIPSPYDGYFRALTKQLAAVEELSNIHYSELNSYFKNVPNKINDWEDIDYNRLAAIFVQETGRQICDIHLIQWQRNLELAGVSTIGDVKKIIHDSELREKLHELSVVIRGELLSNEEWYIYSALLHSEVSVTRGMEIVGDAILNNWSGKEEYLIKKLSFPVPFPETIEGYIECLEDSEIHDEKLELMGGISRCERCAAKIIRPTNTAKVILEHFDNPKIDIDLEELLWSLDLPIGPQLESKENSGYCQYCSDLVSKTD